MIDNIIRADWKNPSPYMRNKKITHGMVALCVSMRQAIWNIKMHDFPKNCRQSQLFPVNKTTNNCYTTEICIQFVMNISIMVIKK